MTTPKPDHDAAPGAHQRAAEAAHADDQQRAAARRRRPPPIAVALATSPAQPPQDWVTRPTSLARCARRRAHRQRGDARVASESAAAAAAPAGDRARRAARRRGRTSSDEHAELDRRARRRRAPAGRAGSRVGALELGRAEVGSRLRRHDRVPLARAQEQHRRLGDHHRGDEGDGQAKPSPAPKRRYAMHVAILSDIHGNRHAFEAVIAAAEAPGAEELWCLGDLVGYGAEPDACVALADAHCAICLAGNHDLAVVDVLSLEDFSRGAALAAQWTQETISPETREFLLALEPAGERRGLRALPRLPARPDLGVRALRPDRRAVLRRDRLPRLVHRPLARRALVPPARGRAGHAARPAARATELDISSGEWLINPGSTGQPRDGDPRAAWLLLDTERQTATSGARSTTSRARRRRSAPPACRTRWPSAFSTVSELAWLVDETPASLLGVLAVAVLAGCGQSNPELIPRATPRR